MTIVSRQVDRRAERKPMLTAKTGGRRAPRVRANAKRPDTPAGQNEAVFVRHSSYAGEKGGFRVTRLKGHLRTLVMKARRAKAAILSAVKIEEIAEASPAKPARKPRAKKAVAE